MARHLNKLESPSPKDALCQVWLKLAQWFWRRRWKCEKFTDRQTDGQTDGRTDGRTDRQRTTGDQKFSSGELKIDILHMYMYQITIGQKAQIEINFIYKSIFNNSTKKINLFNEINPSWITVISLNTDRLHTEGDFTKRPLRYERQLVTGGQRQVQRYLCTGFSRNSYLFNNLKN